MNPFVRAYRAFLSGDAPQPEQPNRNAPYYPLSSFSGIGLNSDLQLTQSEWGAVQAYNRVVAVKSAVDAIAENATLLPLVIRDKDGNDVARSDGTANQSRMLEAIRESSAVHGIPLMQLWVYSLVLHGEAFIEIGRNEFGYAKSLKWLNPTAVWFDESVDSINQIKEYRYTGLTRQAIIPSQNMIYTRLFNPSSDLHGMSPVLVAMGKANIELNFDRYTLAYYTNAGQPGLVISTKTPQPIDDIRKLAEWWREQFRGVSQFFKTHISHIPLDINQMQPIDIDKPMLVSERAVTSIYTALRVSPEMVGDTSKNPYQYSPEKKNAFIQTVIRNYLTTIEESLNNIIYQFEPSGHTVHFDYSQFGLVSDTEFKLQEQSRQDYQIGAITLNEYLAETGRKPVEGGDVYLAGVLANPDEPVKVDQPIPLVRQYEDIDFTPTDAMAEEAERGLAWRREYGRGGTEVGVARARDISNKRTLSPDTVYRMKSYFARHEVDKDAEGFNVGEEGYPSNGRIAWALWGGDAGQSWANVRVERMEAEDDSTRDVLNAWLSFDETLLKNDGLREFELSQWRASGGQFDFNHLLGDVSDLLLSEDDRETLFNRASELIHYRAIQATRLDFEMSFEDVLMGAVTGAIDRRRWSTIVRSQIKKFGAKAYGDGIEDGGADRDELDQNDFDTLAQLTKQQSEYVTSLGAILYSKEKPADRELLSKAGIWFRKSIMPFYHAGLASADKNGMYEWVLGRTEEHCETCATANRQRHRMKAWVGSGILPQNTGFKDILCGGYHCDCRLVAVRSKSRGRLDRIPVKG